MQRKYIMAVGEEGIFDKIKNVFNNLKELLSEPKWQFTILFMLLIFVGVAVFGYNKYYKPIQNKDYVQNKEFIKGGEFVEGINIYYFYTTWCPHCKQTKPIWDEFKELPMFSGGKYRGTDVTFIEVDCDKKPKLADKFNVKGYPTIKLAKADQIIEYDAKPDIETLKQFVKTSA